MSVVNGHCIRVKQFFIANRPVFAPTAEFVSARMIRFDAYWDEIESLQRISPSQEFGP